MVIAVYVNDIWDKRPVDKTRPIYIHHQGQIVNALKRIVYFAQKVQVPNISGQLKT
jgi:hypothetical protein